MKLKCKDQNKKDAKYRNKKCIYAYLILFDGSWHDI